jgi:hypothetical protein
MKIAVGIATATPIANEVSQADGRLELNPTLAMVCTSDIVIAMIAGTRYGTYLGSMRWPLGLGCPAGVAFMSTPLSRHGWCYLGWLIKHEIEREDKQG